MQAFNYGLSLPERSLVAGTLMKCVGHWKGSKVTFFPSSVICLLGDL